MLLRDLKSLERPHIKHKVIVLYNHSNSSIPHLLDPPSQNDIIKAHKQRNFNLPQRSASEPTPAHHTQSAQGIFPSAEYRPRGGYGCFALVCHYLSEPEELWVCGAGLLRQSST